MLLLALRRLSSLRKGGEEVKVPGYPAGPGAVLNCVGSFSYFCISHLTV